MPPMAVLSMNGTEVLNDPVKIGECDGFTYLNPGSVSIPKEGSRHSYMVLEDGVFKWKDLENKEVYMEYKPVI